MIRYSRRRILVPQVEIRIQGQLDQTWAEWLLDGFTLTHAKEGGTILTGEVKDQAALYGLIAKLRDLGVNLISINFNSKE